MPRALLLCTTIVAAFQLQLAAASPHIEDAPVTPAVSAIAARLGIEAARDRVDFLSEVTRLLYTPPDVGNRLRALQSAARAPSSDAGAVRVPVPLPAEVWGRAVFRRAVSREELIAAIVSDRSAALLAHGLTGADDETLAFFADHPALLTFLYERAAGAFAAFGDTFRVAGGRIVVPGGAEAEPLWEAVVHESVSAPERFARALFASPGGRIAYLHSVIASADQAAARFALGLWMADEGARIERFIRLADTCISSYHEWRVHELPFSRPLSDLAVLLLRLQVLPTGAPAPPAGRAFWAGVLDIGDLPPGVGLAAPAAGALVDAAWLVEATGGGDMYTRGERLDQFAFGQRVFAELPEESVAGAGQTLRAFPGYRMLLLTLERIGIRNPAVYTAALRQASAVSAADHERRFWAIAQYQGSLAIVSRMHRAGTIDGPAAERLVLSLARVPADAAGTYAGGIGEWIETGLGSSLPPGASWEERVAAALAGPPAAASAARLFWEGQAYRIDLPFAERRRLEAVREKQGGHTVDVALDILAHARALRSVTPTANSAPSVAAAMRATATAHRAALGRPAVNLLAAGVETPPDGFEWLIKAAGDVEKIGKSGDLRRTARIAGSISELADIVLGNALISLAYAVDLGDADGTALLGANVALRHDFGFARRDRGIRERIPWSLPRQDFMPGVPWHITGSLLGLDIALAPLALRRLTLDGLPDAPKLSSIEREAFAVGVSLMEPARLTDRDRDAIAAAIKRGRQSVRAIAAGTMALAAVEETLMLDGRRRRAVEWTVEHDPGAFAGQFSLAELFLLGGGAAEADLDAWGASGVHAWGCACTRFPPIGAWRILAGRPQLPFMAGTLAELNLNIVLMMSEMKLPAALTRAVLAPATRDFIHDSAPIDPNDWWSLVRTAQSVRRQRVEDYVAAAAAVDGPLVPEPSGVSPQP
ncbi:MAG: hypothetical protein GEU82_12225 [Luteitalea sp.]|nr:hypothetical protein [Luteitalea sp.]